MANFSSEMVKIKLYKFWWEDFPTIRFQCVLNFESELNLENLPGSAAGPDLGAVCVCGGGGDGAGVGSHGKSVVGVGPVGVGGVGVRGRGECHLELGRSQGK
jgi:hypothetical protein